MKKLTLKEKKFIENYAETGNKAQSVIKAGYNIGSQGGKEKNRLSIASQIGATRLKKVEIQKSLEEILDSEGISKREVVKVMKELLTCQDKRVQLGVLDQLHKILGNYSPEKKMIMSRSEIYTEIKELPEQVEQKLLEPKEEIKELEE